MLDAGERAYAYTKACGIIGKSFVGNRLASLGKLRTLGEFDRLLFPELRRELPSHELLLDLEKRIVGRSVNHILKIVNAYRNPPELLVRLLRSYEYSDLKTCLHYLAGGMKKIPAVSNLGRFGTVHFQAFPDLQAMLAGTEFTFLLDYNPAALSDLAPIETELDKHYYLSLKNSLRHLSWEDRSIAERILAEEISLRNCCWALRMRTYFNKSPAEAAKYLMDFVMHVGLQEIPGGIRQHRNAPYLKEIALAEEAVQALDMPLDSRQSWHAWRWERFLNPERGGEWRADPRYFQNAASEYLYQLASHSLHRLPMSSSAGFCFIKLKQFEEDILTSVAEGLSLGMAGADVFGLLESAASVSVHRAPASLSVQGGA
jgi:vacuolar-type H+-ATPase subunit C/Vma6